MVFSYDDMRRRSEEAAAALGQPRFYRDLDRELRRTKSLADTSAAIARARQAIADRGDRLGHGLYHAEKVAIEAGAIVYRETSSNGDAEHLAALAVTAGYLHDIRRDEKDHPEKGAVRRA
jgi:HD superfamily phosphodiesterase